MNPPGASFEPRVLVLMATFNGAPWLAEQLASIAGQRGVAVAIRVSDDRSGDGTATVLRRFAESHPTMQWTVRAAPSGSAGANFKSLFAEADLTGFDHVALADQDDVWEPDHLQRGCAALRANPTAGGYSCAVRTFGTGKSSILAQDATPRALDYLFEGAGQGCTFVLTLETARRMQARCREQPELTTAIHYHDWLVYLVVRTAGATWVFDAHPSLKYRQHGANEIGARSGAGAIRRRVALIRSGWYKRQVAAALALAQASASAPTSSGSPLARFRAVFGAAPSPARRARLALLVLREGRRRPVDRFILGVAALVGWL